MPLSSYTKRRDQQSLVFKKSFILVVSFLEIPYPVSLDEYEVKNIKWNLSLWRWFILDLMLKFSNLGLFLRCFSVMWYEWRFVEESLSLWFFKSFLFILLHLLESISSVSCLKRLIFREWECSGWEYMTSAASGYSTYRWLLGSHSIMVIIPLPKLGGSPLSPFTVPLCNSIFSE